MYGQMPLPSTGRTMSKTNPPDPGIITLSTNTYCLLLAFYPTKTTKTSPAIRTSARRRRMSIPRAENNERIIDNSKNQFYNQFSTSFVQFMTVWIAGLVQTLLKLLPRFTPGVFGVRTRGNVPEYQDGFCRANDRGQPIENLVEESFFSVSMPISVYNFQ